MKIKNKTNAAAACQNENEEQRHTQLEEKQRRVKNENEEQRHTRLEDMQHQAYE